MPQLRVGSIAPRATRTRVERQEEKVDPISRLTVKSPVRKATPFDNAINGLAATLNRKKPRKAGRIRVSFTIGKQGQVENAFVVSFVPKLDRDLEKQLTTYKFDPAFAGAVVSRTVSVKAAKPTKRKKRRRAKRIQ